MNNKSDPDRILQILYYILISINAIAFILLFVAVYCMGCKHKEQELLQKAVEHTAAKWVIGKSGNIEIEWINH